MDGEASRALLLDNDLFFVAKVTEKLRHAGYTTRAVRRTEDFERALGSERPAVALVNTQARRLDWRAAIAAAREVGVPVIAFGAHLDTATQEAARQAGATRVISNAKLASDLAGIVARVVAQPAGAQPANEPAAGDPVARRVRQEPETGSNTGQEASD